MLHFVQHDKDSQTRGIAFGVPKPGLFRHKTQSRTAKAVLTLFFAVSGILPYNTTIEESSSIDEVPSNWFQ